MSSTADYTYRTEPQAIGDDRSTEARYWVADDGPDAWEMVRDGHGDHAMSSQHDEREDRFRDG